MTFQVTIAELIAFVTFVTLVGPFIYWLGRLSKQVDRNSADIAVIFKRIEVIHNYVKNGGRQ